MWANKKTPCGMLFFENLFFSYWHQWRHLVLLTICGQHLPGRSESPSLITDEIPLWRNNSYYSFHVYKFCSVSLSVYSFSDFPILPMATESWPCKKKSFLHRCRCMCSVWSQSNNRSCSDQWKNKCFVMIT